MFKTKYKLINAKIIVFAIMLLAGFVRPPAALAATCNWIAGNGSWTTSTNWSCDSVAAVPTNTDDVVIDANAVVQLTAATEINSLVMGNVSGTTTPTLNFAYDAVSNGPLLVSGGDVVIHENATITHTAANLGTVVGKINIEVAFGDVLVAGQINADAKGYAGGQNSGSAVGHGPGGGYGQPYQFSNSNGAGGGFGGRGQNATGAGGAQQGTTFSPTSLMGSGGGFGGSYPGQNNPGGAGGGAIKLTAQTIDVTGNITANGGTPAGRGGGGSGGAIELVADELTGNGNIRANGGGPGPTSGQGAGGGGRIEILLETDLIFSGNISSLRGSLSLVNSHNGTALVRNVVNDALFIVSANGFWNKADFDSLTIDTWHIYGSLIAKANMPDSYTINANNLHIYAGGNLGLEGAYSSSTDIALVSVAVAQDLIIEATASITSNETGFNGGTYAADQYNGHGPGGGGGGVHQFGSRPGAGGGYGGVGATTDFPGGVAYGSDAQPTTFGSGGGAGMRYNGGNGSGGRGGGYVGLTVEGILENNGTISANGGNSAGSEPARGGGGAGGGIFLNVGTLVGSGTIQALGGSSADGSPYNQGGVGAGGRISITYGAIDWQGSSLAANDAVAPGTIGVQAPTVSGVPTGIGTVVLTGTASLPQVLAQYRSNAITTIPVGGSTEETTVIFKFLMAHGDPETLTPQVELQEIETDFTDTPTHVGSGINFTGGASVEGTVTASGLTDLSSYHWQARVCDSLFNCSGWVSFGGNDEADPDFTIVTNVAPNTPTSLGPNNLVNGSLTTDNTPTVNFSVSDNNVSDQVRYQIEIDNNSNFSTPEVVYVSSLSGQGSRSFTVGQAASGGSYTQGAEGQTLGEGNQYWRVKAIDEEGLESSYATARSGNIAFRVDTQPPTVPGTPNTPTPTADSTPTWTWTASTDAVAGVSQYNFQWCNNSEFTGCSNSANIGSTSYTHSSLLTDGVWYARVRAIDFLSHTSAFSNVGQVEIDATAPTNPGQPTTSTPTNNSTPTWTWTASIDTNTGLPVYDYEIEWATCADFTCTTFTDASNTNSFTHPSGLDDGTWYFRVAGVDDFNNTSAWSSNGVVVVDTIAPEVPNAPSGTSPVADSTPTLTWNAVSDVGTGVWRYRLQWCQNSAFTSCEALTRLINGLSGEPSPGLTNGSWYFRVQAIDFAQNTSAYSSDTQIDIDLNAPTDPGQPTTTTPTSNATPTWSWPASIDNDNAQPVSDYEIEWATCADFSCTTFTDSSSTNSFTHTDDLSDGVWYLRVRGLDELGNASGYSAAGTVLIDTTPPTTPGTPNTSTPTTNVSPSFTWSAATDSGSGLLTTNAYQLQWCASSSFGSECNANTIRSTSSPATLNLGDGIWFVRVRAEDRVGNFSNYSASVEVEIDSSPPSVPGTPNTTNPTINRLPTWTWFGSTDTGIGMPNTNAYQVHWCQNSNFNFCTPNMAYADDTEYTHTVELSGGGWYMRVRSYDELGNASNWSTPGYVLIDYEPPTAPGQPTTISPTNNQHPEISWDASNDPDSELADPAYTLQWCANQDFIGCDSQVASSNTTTYTMVTELTEGTWYLRAQARDILDNLSAYSATGSAVIDLTPPNLSSLHFAGTSQVTVTWDPATDNVQLASSNPYTLFWCNNQNFIGCDQNVSVQQTNSKILDLTPGDWFFRLQARDQAGNQSTSGIYQVIILHPGGGSGGGGSDNGNSGGGAGDGGSANSGDNNNQSSSQPAPLPSPAPAPIWQAPPATDDLGNPIETEIVEVVEIEVDQPLAGGQQAEESGLGLLTGFAFPSVITQLDFSSFPFPLLPHTSSFSETILAYAPILVLLAVPASAAALLGSVGGSLFFNPRIWLRAIQALGVFGSKQPQGFVFDKFSNQPVAFATIQYVNELGVNEVSVTNQYGIYQGVTLPAGKYSISVSHPEYRFIPSSNVGLVSNRANYYLGGNVEVKTKSSPAFMQIPMTPILGIKTKPTMAAIFRRWLIWFSYLPVLELLIALSLIVVLAFPSIINIALAAGYLVLWGYKKLQIILIPTLLGKVTDEKRKPLANVLLRLSAGSGLQNVVVGISDTKGHFSLKTQKGNYQFQISLPGYRQKINSNELLSQQEINLQNRRNTKNIQLQKVDLDTDFFVN